MTGEDDPTARLIGWLRWVLRGDVDLGWARPRRALLPVGLWWSLWLLAALHKPLSYTHPCVTEGRRCGGGLSVLVDLAPGELLAAVALHLAAAVFAYALAVGTTTALASWVDLEAVAPRVFDPADDALVALGVLAAAALVAYLAGVYHLAPTIAGALALYVVYFPPLALGALLMVLPYEAVVGALPPPVVVVLWLVFFVVLPTAQVLWLYGLAHAIVAPMRRV